MPTAHAFTRSGLMVLSLLSQIADAAIDAYPDAAESAVRVGKRQR
jgi:hypothetical protein